MRDPVLPPPGRPLTESQRQLIALLAEVAVENFLREEQHASLPDTSEESQATVAPRHGVTKQ